MGKPFGLCAASSFRLGVTGAALTLLSSVARPGKLSLDVKSAPTAEEQRSSVCAGAGDCLWLSGSTWNRRFLKGSLEEDLSADRLRDAPVSEPGRAPLTGQRISRVSVPVLAGGAGEPPVTRASPARPLQSGGVPGPALPRSRWVVRRSSGAVATDCWSPFMVMILGINRGTRRSGAEEVSGARKRKPPDVQWQLGGGSVHPECPLVRNNSHPREISWEAIKTSPCFPFCVTCVFQITRSNSLTRRTLKKPFMFEEEPAEVRWGWCASLPPMVTTAGTLQLRQRSHTDTWCFPL